SVTCFTASILNSSEYRFALIINTCRFAFSVTLPGVYCIGGLPVIQNSNEIDIEHVVPLNGCHRQASAVMWQIVLV
ncbi:hypothetical protein DYI22_09755, partial [Marinobacter lipolyticus]|uniref:hypothetical protein n=1 Tax=Marinobacter lipolyticus TaxID=209639 RepID=UPI001BD18FE5